jgi:hypothetical protein
VGDGVGLAARVFVGLTSVGIDEGASVMAAGYAQAGTVGRMVGTREEVGRTGEGVGDGSGIVETAVGAV